MRGDEDVARLLAKKPHLEQQLEEIKALLASLSLPASEGNPDPEWRRRTKEQLLEHLRRRRRPRSS